MKRRSEMKPVESGRDSKEVEDDSWYKPLDDISINSDSWWCMVILMVETVIEHSKCVSLFNAAAEEGSRKAIYCLSYKKMLASIRVLSKQGPDKCSPIQRVCHYANKLLYENNGRLFSWLLARVIKYLVYRAKEEIIDIGKKKIELEKQIDEEYRIMQTVADWGAKKLDADQFNSKANTRLRKRDEDWRNTVYVDDAPLNGPNLYVILTGFYDPDLPDYLINSGVPLMAIVRMKRSNEQLDCLSHGEEVPMESSDSRRQMQFLGNNRTNKADLYRFWTTTERRFVDLEAYSVYRDIALLTFCPPEIPDSFEEDEYETHKKNMYDHVSYFVYDIYDVYRQHLNYLKSMKIQKGMVGQIQEKYDMEVYKSVLDGIPQEHVSVPLILFAMLAHVETKDAASSKGSINEKGDASIVLKTSTENQVESETRNSTGSSFIEEKLRPLNVMFDLVQDNAEETTTEIELIRRGDFLTETLRLVDYSGNSNILNGTDFIDRILPIFRHPIITNLHSRQQITKKKLREYYQHLKGIRFHFDYEISDEEIRHYLHILVLDRMLNGSFQCQDGISRKVKKEEQGSTFDFHNTLTPIRESKSLPSLSSKLADEINFLSDYNIQYGKFIPTIDDYSPLFDLIDPRELLVPGYLEQNVFKTRCKEKLNLAEYEDVELLPKQVFLQFLHQCLHLFDRFEARYFEPTDSVLLYFTDKRIVNGVHEEKSMCTIRTSVCLHDFYKYVVVEEEDWIRREEEQYRLETTQLMERLMEETKEIYEQAVLFRDEDFILAGSLKAKVLEKSDRFIREAAAETTERSGNGKSGSRKNANQKKDKINNGSTAKDKKSSVDNVSPLTFDKSTSVPTTEQAETYEFLGYDLGRLRVQLTNSTSTFLSKDGTLVRVEIDDWLYTSKDLRIIITIGDYTLRLSHRITGTVIDEVFHIVTKTGVILAIRKSLGSQHALDVSQFTWRYHPFDFRASWPSGLLIEPVIGDGPENPFYIQQSYIPTSSGKTNKTHEVCRKFLRNGTVLKYFDDGKVIVLRLNGNIVTCTGFKEFDSDKNDDSLHDVHFAKGDASSKGVRHSSADGKKHTRFFKNKLTANAEGDYEVTPKHSATTDVRFSEMTNATIKVSRYTVLNHDGRQYEVLDDLVVSEHHRLLVRTESDYEVDEKFTRRADGTNMLLNSNGELIVGFPDGTRIITGYTIEREPVICDWTEEEIQRYFTSGGMVEQQQGYNDELFSNLKLARKTSSGHEIEYNDDFNDILIADGFISVQLTCRMEHKNYATVFYDQSAVGCTLSVSNDLQLSIFRRDHYEVSMENGVNLKITKDSLRFSGNTCQACGKQSVSTYKFPPRKQSATIFSTVDVFGNIFEVMGDGTTRYHSVTKPTGRRKSDGREKEECHQESRGEGGMEENENLEGKHYSDHQKLYLRARGNQHRMFSINRDLTAYEYLHRSERNRTEVEAVLDNETSVILYQSSRRPKLRRLITFETVKPESRSKTALSFPDYEIRPTNFDRRDLLRSTHSIPYDWTFPFGRNGNGIWINTHDVPLTADAKKEMPKLLYIRIQYGFKEPDGNAVIELQRALGRYWMSMFFVKFTPSISTIVERKRMRQEMMAVCEQLEDEMHDLALGIKKTIDVATYRFGLERQWKVPKSTVRRTSIRFHEFRKRRALEREKLKWYKRCITEGYILPYFENVTGTCFHLVQDCVENALNVSLAKLLQNTKRNSTDSEQRPLEI